MCVCVCVYLSDGELVDIGVQFPVGEGDHHGGGDLCFYFDLLVHLIDQSMNQPINESASAFYTLARLTLAWLTLAWLTLAWLTLARLTLAWLTLASRWHSR